MIINHPLAFDFQHHRAGGIGERNGFDVDRHRRRLAAIREKGARNLVGIFELGDGAAWNAGGAESAFPAPGVGGLVDKGFHSLFEEGLENPGRPEETGEIRDGDIAGRRPVERITPGHDGRAQRCRIGHPEFGNAAAGGFDRKRSDIRRHARHPHIEGRRQFTGLLQQILIGLGELAVHVEHLGDLVGGGCRAGKLLVQHLEMREQLFRWRASGLAAIGLLARCGRAFRRQHVPQSRIGIGRVHRGGQNGCRRVAFSGGGEGGGVCSGAQIGRLRDRSGSLHHDIAFIGKRAGCFHGVAKGLGRLDPKVGQRIGPFFLETVEIDLQRGLRHLLDRCAPECIIGTAHPPFGKCDARRMGDLRNDDAAISFRREKTFDAFRHRRFAAPLEGTLSQRAEGRGGCPFHQFPRLRKTGENIIGARADSLIADGFTGSCDEPCV